MFKTTQPFPRRHSAFQHGQSIVVALLVLLLLGLAGALFVTIIARNLINARHANRLQTADQYASAGITYADAQLSSSVDGADWRPPLQYRLAANYLPIGTRELARYNAVKSTLTDPTTAPYSSDPDLEYLVAGYTRYNTGAGRFLLRVTYDPVNVNLGANGVVSTVPPGKYLKIESIGREGVIDTIDPTTYTNNRTADRLNAYHVAYKPIGITDYARFETNPDKRSDIANLGVASEFHMDNPPDLDIATPGVSDFNSTGDSTTTPPTPPTIQEYPILTTYGAADAYMKSGTTVQPNPNAGGGFLAPGYTAVPGGGSIHANMPVRFFGTNIIYLNNAGVNAPLFQDTAEIAGDLLLDSYDQKAKLNNSTLDTSVTPSIGQQAALILNPTDLTTLKTSGTPITPSNDNQSAGDVNPAFSTQGGLIRDGSMQNDSAGLPRSVTRLEPPLMDAQDSASQMPRYRAIAMNSAPRTDPTSTATPQAAYPATASQYGYGKAIYVNNPNDIQQDSTSIGGGSTLTDEWLHRTSSIASATVKGNWNGLFYNPPGVNITLGQIITPAVTTGTTSPAVFGIRLVRSAGDQFTNPDGTPNGGAKMDVKYSDLDTDTTGAASDNDIIIYAEGNVRVRGILSPNEGTGNTATTQKYVPRHITIVTNGTAYIEGNLLKGDPDSTISVLAHDYVCVNTTQFLAGPTVEEHTDGTQSPELPNPGAPLTLDADHSLLQEFNFGLTGTNPTTDTVAAHYGSNKLALYISAGPAGGGGPTRADIDILNSAGTTVLSAPLISTFSTFTQLTYDLSASTGLTGAFGTDLFQLKVSKDNGQEDPNGVSSLAPQDVSLERAAILPMDIRIEAVLYAQTRSFFVIPGEWFNTNSDDNLSNYLTRGTRSNAVDQFPMYGQPIDLKITIDGSVSEAHPADIAAQTAWMQKWGWIPQYHGSLLSERNGHPLMNGASPSGPANLPAVGLQIIYNPQAGYPYHPGAGGANNPAYYLRSDVYGRPLPFTPKLPVSTGLLYSGQSGEAPLLQ